jgi:hypothetical protein
MTLFFRVAVLVCSVSCFTFAHADVVSDWNEIAVSALKASPRDPRHAARALAGVHIAMLEALNFVEGKYVPRFTVRLSAPLDATGDAAAASAAHYVLSVLYQDRGAVLREALERSLEQLPDSNAKGAGRLTGRAIGGNIVAVWGPLPGPRRARVRDPGTIDDLLKWNALASARIEAQGLSSIESARVLALVSIALAGVYADNAPGASAPAEREHAARAAALAILSSEFGPVTSAIAGASAQRPVAPLLIGAAESLPAKFGTDRPVGAMVAPGDLLGRRYAAHALQFYRLR